MLKFLEFVLICSAFTNRVNSQNVPGVCFCVTSGTCNNGTGGGGTDGTGQIVNISRSLSLINF